ncbi:MAG: S9 family peptidase [Ferruginibacter sp.]|nr:S9 family peptidase [Ferruginibacter sp.]
MKKCIGFCFFVFLVCLLQVSVGQSKKPLDHGVYDSWKSLGERKISNNGKYIAYAVNPQEGDGDLCVKWLSSGKIRKIERGFNAAFTEDNLYLVCRVKPLYAQTRSAKIKKKTGNDLPADSLVVLNLVLDTLFYVPEVKSFSIPEKGSGWLGYLAEVSQKKDLDSSSLAHQKEAKRMLAIADSVLKKAIDSAKGNLSEKELRKALQKVSKEIQKQAKDNLEPDGPSKDAPGNEKKNFNTLVLRQLTTGKEWVFRNTDNYLFDKMGTRIVIEQKKDKADSSGKSLVLVANLDKLRFDTIMQGFNDATGFCFDEGGKQLAFVAERDSSEKALQRFYKLWFFRDGADSAILYADRNKAGMPIGSGISEQGKISFSRNGKRLFFGTAPIKPAADTSLVDFELAKLDIWHYNDDYLQPKQLLNLAREENRSYLAVINLGDSFLIQLGSPGIEDITLADEGNANWVLGTTTKNNRIASQWEGRTRQSAFLINCFDGKATPISTNRSANFSPSPDAGYIYWYDYELKNYFAYDVLEKITRNISLRVPQPLYDTEEDMPELPDPVGNMGWSKYDSAFFVYDMYDIWKLDPKGILSPENLTNGWGRTNRVKLEYLKTNQEERFISPSEILLLKGFNRLNKEAGLFYQPAGKAGIPQKASMGPYRIASLLKARDTSVYLLQNTNISSSELYLSSNLNHFEQLTSIADQQKPYNWLTVSLEKWKMFDGRMSEGLLFKPENFDPKKKYPIIFYFYERNADGLYLYRTPAPSASVINIPWFVSNGYLVFDPNIYYKTGDPGQSAYNSVVSAAKYFSKMPWVDSTRMGIQGQSWGGYEVAYLVTRTNIFRAASAGAPVSNMTSAYGGIRWESGANRQFQYEKTQSRIGATLWENREAYIRNSPLFFADKITTPLLIMHNDNDGAVPWYQGIELFTAMKRLNKKVWLLQYNGEAHNLMERRNRKDLSIRLGQFFGYYLKDEKPASWITNGLPATQKGKSWGTD